MNEQMNKIDKIRFYWVLVLATFVIGLAAMFAIKVAAADGKIDYCYIDHVTANFSYYRVIGHRPWAIDAVFGHSATFDEAKRMYDQACPVK